MTKEQTTQAEKMQKQAEELAAIMDKLQSELIQKSNLITLNRKH